MFTLFRGIWLLDKISLLVTLICFRNVTPNFILSSQSQSPSSNSKLYSVQVIAGQLGTNSIFLAPHGIAYHSKRKEVFVSDTNNHVIRSILTTGSVFTFVGATRVNGSTNGVGTLSRFNFPSGVAFNAYDNNIYVSDTSNFVVRKITISTREVSLFAGSVSLRGNQNGIGTFVRLGLIYASIAYHPRNGIGYVADYGNNQIKIISTSAAVSLLAGRGGNVNHANGIGTFARFAGPIGVTYNSFDDKLYVSDYASHLIRCISLLGEVRTIAGGIGSSGFFDGIGTLARFNGPYGITSDDITGNVYVTDSLNHKIREIFVGRSPSIAEQSVTSTVSFTNFVNIFLPFGITMIDNKIFLNDAYRCFYFFDQQATLRPSARPTGQPSSNPSRSPSSQPFHDPSSQPSSQPSLYPSLQPLSDPTFIPTHLPSSGPTTLPSRQPNNGPSKQPFAWPSSQPSGQPINSPSRSPTRNPSARPSKQPVLYPTSQPSSQPIDYPSSQPLAMPSSLPSSQPQMIPTRQPTGSPSQASPVWVVKVDNFSEHQSIKEQGWFEGVCVASHWVRSVGPSGFCNLQAAVYFCLTRVPWQAGDTAAERVQECRIELPNEHKFFVSLSSPIHIDTSSIVTTIDMDIRITIDGRGSSFQYLPSKSNNNIVYRFIHVGDLRTVAGDGDGESSASNKQLKGIPLSITLVNIFFSNFGKFTGGSGSAVATDYFDGGMIKVSNIRSLIMNNITVLGCHARLGGVIYASQVASVHIYSSRFAGNIALNGGVLFAYYVSKSIVVQSTLFLNNQVRNIGGALVLDSIIASVSIGPNNLFEDNTASNFGGAISFHRIVPIISIQVQRNRFTGNSAKFGSAMVMSACNGPIVNVAFNVFDKNAAIGGGTIYWLASSGMAAPLLGQDIRGNMNQNDRNTNLFGPLNRCGYGCSVATELTGIMTNPRSLYLTDYDSHSYPLKVVAMLVDYYGTIVTSESGNLVKASIDSQIGKTNVVGRCSINNGRTSLRGALSAEVLRGKANFSSLSATCIPGGSLNITFATLVKSFSSEFPQYLLTKPSAALTSSSTFGGSSMATKIARSEISVDFRPCRRGEKFDLDSSSQSSCSICERSYSLQENTDNSIVACNVCPKAASQCYGSTILLKEGSWRWNIEATTVYSCPYPKACKGGNETGNGLCAVGFTGPLCGICQVGYYHSPISNACESCDVTLSYSASAILLVSTGAVVIFMYILIKRNQALIKMIASELYLDSDDDHSSNATNKIGNHSDSISLGGNIYRREISSLQTRNLGDPINKILLQMKRPKRVQALNILKILITTFQVVSGSPVQFHLSIFPLFGSLWSVFDKLNFSFINVVPISCYRRFNYIDTMFYVSMIPLCIVVCMGFCFMLQTWWMKCGITDSGIDNQLIPQRNQENKIKMMYFYIKIFLFMTYYSLPGVVLTICKTFRCIELDSQRESVGYEEKHGSTLRLGVDYSIDCSSEEYIFGFHWALIMVLLYTVVIPLYYFWLLYDHKEQIMNRHKIAPGLIPVPTQVPTPDTFPENSSDVMVAESRKRSTLVEKKLRFIKDIGFIYLMYKPEYWYWELIEFARRLLFTSITSFAISDISRQLFSAFALSVVTYKIYYTCDPYEDKQEGALALSGVVQIGLTMFLGWVFTARMFDDNHRAYIIAEWILIIANVMIVLQAFIYLRNDVLEIRSYKRKQAIIRRHFAATTAARRRRNHDDHIIAPVSSSSSSSLSLLSSSSLKITATAALQLHSLNTTSTTGVEATLLMSKDNNWLLKSVANCTDSKTSHNIMFWKNVETFLVSREPIRQAFIRIMQQMVYQSLLARRATSSPFIFYFSPSYPNSSQMLIENPLIYQKKLDNEISELYISLRLENFYDIEFHHYFETVLAMDYLCLKVDYDLAFTLLLEPYLPSGIAVKEGEIFDEIIQKDDESSISFDLMNAVDPAKLVISQTKFDDFDVECGSSDSNSQEIGSSSVDSL